MTNDGLCAREVDPVSFFGGKAYANSISFLIHHVKRVGRRSRSSKTTSCMFGAVQVVSGIASSIGLTRFKILISVFFPAQLQKIFGRTSTEYLSSAHLNHLQWMEHAAQPKPITRACVRECKTWSPAPKTQLHTNRPHHSALASRKKPTQTHPNRCHPRKRLYRARFYHAELGRFVSRDPIGYINGMNLYRGYFVPDGVDPLGNSWWPGKWLGTRIGRGAGNLLHGDWSRLFDCTLIPNKSYTKLVATVAPYGGTSADQPRNPCNIGGSVVYFYSCKCQWKTKLTYLCKKKRRLWACTEIFMKEFDFEESAIKDNIEYIGPFPTDEHGIHMVSCSEGVGTGVGGVRVIGWFGVAHEKTDLAKYQIACENKCLTSPLGIPEPTTFDVPGGWTYDNEN